MAVHPNALVDMSGPWPVLVTSLSLNIEYQARLIRDAGPGEPWRLDAALEELRRAVDLLGNLVDDDDDDAHDADDAASTDAPGLYL